MENKNMYTNRLLKLSDTGKCYEGHQMGSWVRG